MDLAKHISTKCMIHLETAERIIGQCNVYLATPCPANLQTLQQEITGALVSEFPINCVELLAQVEIHPNPFIESLHLHLLKVVTLVVSRILVNEDVNAEVVFYAHMTSGTKKAPRCGEFFY